MTLTGRAAVAEGAVAATVARLVRSRARPGEVVALVAEPSLESVVALRAIAGVGATALPLSPRLKPRELDAIAAIAEPALVVHDAAGQAAAEQLARPALGLPPGRPGPRVVPGRVLDGSPTPGDLLVATSGTTGRPKLARLSGTALEASAAAWMAFLPAAGGWILALGLAHVAGIGVVWRAALAGLPLVVSSSEPEALLAALHANPGATHLSLVPTQLARLLDAADAAGAPAPPPTLRALLLGGAPIPPALVDRALAAGWPVAPTYGLTEVASGATALSPGEWAAHPGSAGRPLPGVELRIDAPAEDGAGEIQLRATSRFDGYLGDEAATVAALAPDGWLRTGDLGRLEPDGYLTVLDRRTDLIVSGGENVVPAEVEAVLLEHPAVADAGVVGRPDERWGAVPVAAIVLRPGTPDPGDEALLAFARERLARWKVPAAVVRVAALPRSASGKLRRGELRAELDAGPGPGRR